MFTLQTKISMLKAVLTRRSPFYVQFYISKYCHQNCRMCNIVEANKDIQPFLREHIEPIAENLVKIGAGVVLLTGGEPFLRNDIDEIVRIFKEKKLDVRLQTAGLYAKKDKMAACVEYGARDINVSVDSLDEELSDYINGKKGTWKDAIRTISYISRTFPEKGSICALGCVLSRYNIDEIEVLLSFATKIGWWLSLVPVHITVPDRPMHFRGYDQDFCFKPDEYDRVKDLIDRLKQKKREGYLLFDSDEYLDSIYHFVSTGRPDWRHKGVCDTPNLYFVILPDGRFAPCCDFRFDDDIYVYDPDFPEIYHSRYFVNKVKKIAKKCPGCNFGSFPEMSLSARSLSTIKERFRTQLKANILSIKPIDEENIFKLIEEVKKEHNIYPRHRDLLFK